MSVERLGKRSGVELNAMEPGRGNNGPQARVIILVDALPLCGANADDRAASSSGIHLGYELRILSLTVEGFPARYLHKRPSHRSPATRVWNEQPGSPVCRPGTFVFCAGPAYVNCITHRPSTDSASGSPRLARVGRWLL